MGEARLVLIVEGDRQVREFQEFFLRRAGLQVEFADDGVSALERARIDCPRVIITEILIPKLDGLSLCRQLRADPLTAHIPVIVFSILAASARADEAGARAFLRKPIVESTFITTVQDVMAGEPAAMMEMQ